jgi:Tfp pilus assembly protein PilF
MERIMRRIATVSLVTAVVFVAVSLGASAYAQKVKDESGFEREATEIDLMMQTASQLMSAGQWEAAAQELVRVTEKDPDYLNGWTELAACYKALKQYGNAAAAYKSAHELQPGDLDLLSNLGYMQLNASSDDPEQLEAAVGTYNKMLELDPGSYDANVHLGFVYQKQDDDEKAIAYYEKALESNGSDVQTMGSLAELYADNDRVEDSIAMYERAIETSEDAAQKNQFRSKLGASLIEAKDFAKAAEVYGALTEAVPDNPAHHFNRGISLMQVKRHGEAAPHFEKVIELRPETASAYQRLAECYNETGRYSQAIGTAKTGLSHAGDNDKGGLYCAWGRALEKQELYDEAMDVFQRAVNDPQYGDYAKKQIQRQLDLKKRAKMIKQQG